MALPHEFDTVLDRVTNITSDKNFIKWSKPELVDYINEAQREYCEKTMVLRSEGPLISQENTEIFNLPSDCYMVDRVERNDGFLIKKTTSRDLLRQFGERYRISRGSPTHYYQDLDGQKQLRFFPIPSESVLSTYSTIDQNEGAVNRALNATNNPLLFDSEFGVTSDSSQLDSSSEDFNSFNYEEGLVTGVLSTADKVRVWYSRYPRIDKLEIDDIQALSYYALHKCYEKDGPLQNIDLSVLYEKRFQERVNREIGRVSSGQSAEMSVRGYYA